MKHTTRSIQSELFWCGIPNNGSDYVFKETESNCLKCLECALKKDRMNLACFKKDIRIVYNKLKKDDKFNKNIKELLS